MPGLISSEVFSAILPPHIVSPPPASAILPMLPVVTKENIYVGVISKSRILAAYREQLIAISEE